VIGMDSGGRLRVYDFHGLRLGCFAGDAVTAALDARFGRFAQADAGPCDVRFDYRCVGVGEPHAVPAPPEDARPVYESAMGKVLYSERADRMFISSVWPIRAACDPRSGETTVSIVGAVDEHLWALSHPLVTLPLMETLKRRGRFSVHAAGVALGGKGLLIPGSSGSGKSTLALALARAGFGFLGDDMLFLLRAGEGLRALAFPEAFDLTDATVRLFPDLVDLLEVEKQPGWPKRQLRAEERFGAEIVWQCRPVALVFPRVAGSGRSTLTPMDRGEALLEILPNILLTEPASSQQHLDALGQLVSSCACYRLETGTDFAELATRLRGLLESER
jgi:hypothetical protein